MRAPKRSLHFVAGTVACMAFAAIACSSSNGSGSGFTPTGGGGGGGAGGGGGGGGEGGGGGGFGAADDGGSADGANTGDCPESATLVYVTGQGSLLYSFYPPDQTFTKIGKFDCLSDPTHMTVDRQGAAWVVAGGNIYKASTADATCTKVSTWKSDISFFDFSLTFIGVSNTIDNTLYMMNGSANLSSFDIASGTRTPINSVSIPSMMSLGDMTSNGDGTLYFLNDVSKPKLYQVSPKDGSISSTFDIAATGGGTQALAFWGGRFYAFEDSDIYEYDPTMKTTKDIGTAPLMVTGAGQSTCVPKTPPPPK
jgi:hypothetical protein